MRVSKLTREQIVVPFTFSSLSFHFLFLLLFLFFKVDSLLCETLRQYLLFFRSLFPSFLLSSLFFCPFSLLFFFFTFADDICSHIRRHTSTACSFFLQHMNEWTKGAGNYVVVSEKHWNTWTSRINFSQQWYPENATLAKSLKTEIEALTCLILSGWRTNFTSKQ